MEDTQQHQHAMEVIIAHGNPILSISFSCDSSLLATGSRDKTAKVFDMSTLAEIHTLRGHHDHVNSVAFSPTQRHVVATASRDKCVRIWNAVAGTVLHILRDHTAEVHQASFSPDGKTLCSASEDSTLILWSVDKARSMATLHGHSSVVLSCVFSPSRAHFLASCSEDGSIILWNSVTKKQHCALSGHKETVTDIVFGSLKLSNVLISASRDTSIIFWDIDEETKLHIFTIHSDMVTCLSISPNCKLLASVCADATMNILCLANHQSLAKCYAHKMVASCCAFRLTFLICYIYLLFFIFLIMRVICGLKNSNVVLSHCRSKMTSVTLVVIIAQ